MSLISSLLSLPLFLLVSLLRHCRAASWRRRTRRRCDCSWARRSGRAWWPSPEGSPRQALPSIVVVECSSCQRGCVWLGQEQVWPSSLSSLFLPILYVLYLFFVYRHHVTCSTWLYVYMSICGARFQEDFLWRCDDLPGRWSSKWAGVMCDVWRYGMCGSASVGAWCGVCTVCHRQSDSYGGTVP